MSVHPTIDYIVSILGGIAVGILGNLLTPTAYRPLAWWKRVTKKNRIMQLEWEISKIEEYRDNPARLYALVLSDVLRVLQCILVSLLTIPFGPLMSWFIPLGATACVAGFTYGRCTYSFRFCDQLIYPERSVARRRKTIESLRGKTD